MISRAEAIDMFNSSDLIMSAALAGQGLAWVPDDIVGDHIDAGRLVSVLEGNLS